MALKNIVILASGEGTNALNIIEFFKKTGKARVSLLISGKGNAPVVLKAMLSETPVMVLDRPQYYAEAAFSDFLFREKTDLIVLAGFLWLLPENLVKAFSGRILNIHPALLPRYGGKGMYGMNVHKAVIAAGEKESGISIHQVNERFDEGAIVFQAKCTLEPGETPESLAQKVHQLEHEHYPRVIEQVLHL